MLKLFAFITIQLLSFSAYAQLLNDADAKQLITKGLDKLYNYNFKEADAYFQKVKSKYPNHPVAPLLSAIQVQWQNLPLEKNPKAVGTYMSLLEKCQKAAEPMLGDANKKAEATFFLLAAHGYTALAYTYRKEPIKAANEARKAYGYMKDGFKLTEHNPEFYFTTGLYNYYRIQYPDTHPMVKPLVIFFENGNKRTGLNQLEQAIQKSVFSRIEAAYYYMHVCLKYELNYNKGLAYADWLHDKYPENPVYLMRYTEALIMTGKFDEATPKIGVLHKINGPVYQLAAHLFEATIAEKSKRNDKLALDLYNQVLRYEPDERYTKDYYAMAYLGIGRIADRAGNKKRADEMYKKALEYAENRGVVTEAKKNLER
ncbi:M48 family metallopeptidase [Emticicia sp. 21SJ11W-3]|uniref:tetratricopeptide repeat protein n=1 Tax=Emticicia sp. 21SJ11W-3 TaxID=2916755 RepID=UPI0020A06A6C|nr:ABC transporter substrate-binding protein [Emticicia sp. 21SJ11W-3]UTA69372.1 ABC transporter substrate-binding protein [Emticicia sp. 21SJ11W-3]